MNLMPKPRIWYRLLPLLLLLGVGHAAPSALLAPIGYLPAAAQQESGQAAAAPDSNQPSPLADQKLSLSDQVVQDVFEPLRAGIVGQDVSQIMSVFDKQATPGYASLQQQLRAFFELYSEVRFRYQILQVTADKDHGSATAEIAMDAMPYEVTQIPQRRSVQMRFQLKLTAKGWKAVSFTPADFFTPGFNRAEAR
jgi:hypothetical protein